MKYFVRYKQFSYNGESSTEESIIVDFTFTDIEIKGVPNCGQLDSLKEIIFNKIKVHFDPDHLPFIDDIISISQL